MTGPESHSRFSRRDMTERQLKSFKAMYEDLSYTTTDICTRFGMSQSTVLQLAQNLNLKIRPARGGRHE